MDRMRLLCLVGGVSASATLITSRNKDRIIPRKPDTGHDGEAIKIDPRRRNFSSVINQARQLTLKLKNEVGAPGIVVGVSVDGEVVWEEGIGFADLENQVPANGDTVMRIASISKSLTAAVVGRLFQEGAIDLDQPIQKYVPSFPIKTVGDKTVTITTRQLMSHLSGIRHYTKKKESEGSGDGQFQEFYSKERFESVEKALSIFKDDELIHAPGSKYLYTTYGWTVVSAVMEGATGKTYPQIMRVFLRRLGMRRTYLDEPEPIIYGRSKCYMKNKNGKLVNCPYVDNSCKWAGGGFLSTVGDLLKFSNAMLYSYQFDDGINVRKSVSNAESNTKPSIKDTTIGLKTLEELQETVNKQKRVKSEQREKSQSCRKEKAVPTGEDRSNVAVVEPDDSSRQRMKSESAIDQTTKEKAVSPVEDTTSALVIAGYALSGLKAVTKGVGDVGSYVWNTFGKEGEKSESSSNETSKEKAVPTAEDTTSAAVIETDDSSGQRMKSESAIDQTTEEKAVSPGEDTTSAAVVASYASSGLKAVTKGVGDVGSYVWNMFGKEGEKSESSSNETSNEKSVPTSTAVVSSYASSGLKSVAKGVDNVSSYVWNTGWKIFGSQGKEPGHVEDESIPRTVSEDEAKSSDKKENSWTKSFKNLFNPKALDETSPVLVVEQSDIKSSHEFLKTGEEREHLWIDHILPSAVNIVLGISNEVNGSDAVWDDTIPLKRELSLNNPYILPDTIALLWTHVEKTRFSDWGPYVEGGYGLGFGVAPAIECPGGVADGGQPFMVGHTGGAVGASSAMIIVPRAHHHGDSIPKGVAVVILTNLQSVSLNPLAIEIARLFGQASA